MVRSGNGRSRPELPGGGFLLNVNLVFVSTVFSYGLAFLSGVLLARALDRDERGVAALYQSAVSLGFAFLSLGIATAVVYYVGRRAISGRQAAEAGLSITVVATAITAAGVLIAALAFDDRLSEAGMPYWLAVVAVPAVVQFRVVEAVLRAQGRFGAMNLLEVSLPLSILGTLAAVELIWGLDVRRAVIAWSLAFLPPVVFGYLLLGPSGWPRRLAERGLLWESVQFGVQGQLSNMVQLLNYRLDTILLAVLLNASGVAVYAIAVPLSEGLWFIANSVAVVLLTRLTAGDDEFAASMTPVVCRNTLLVTAVAALAAALVSPLAIPLVYSDLYRDSVLPFVLLLPGAVALAGTKIFSAYVFSRGKPLINAQIAIVTLIVGIVADLILIPLLKVPGAAIAASLDYSLALILSALAYRRLSGRSIADALVPRRSDVSLYVDGMRSLVGRLPILGRAEGGRA
jgi:O-antigen/teichoic acid export membrane protein